MVGGGDGTVRVVAEILADTDIAMGVVPLGTGNLLARNIHLDLDDLHGSVHTALFGQERSIDTAGRGVENSRTGDHRAHVPGDGRYRHGRGGGGRHQRRAEEGVGWLAYTEAGMRHLPGRRNKVTISLDDQPEQSRKIRSVLFANCGLIPGGIDLIPQAMIDDGKLDVVVMSPRSALGWLAMYGKIVLKHKRNLPVMTYYRSGKIVISCAEPMPTQVDGDPSGEATKVTVQVAPGSLLVRVKDGTEGD